MECIFYNPVNVGSSTEDFEFSQLSCEDYFEMVENTSTGAIFYVEKKIDYADVVFFVVLTLAIFLLVCKEIYKFLWK